MAKKKELKEWLGEFCSWMSVPYCFLKLNLGSGNKLNIGEHACMKTFHQSLSRSLPHACVSESIERDLSDCPARDKASDDLPTPFCPSSTILSAPPWLW